MNKKRFNFDNVLPKPIKLNLTKTKKIKIQSHKLILKLGKEQETLEIGKNIIFFCFLLSNLIFLIIIFNLFFKANINSTIKLKDIKTPSESLRGKILDRNNNIISASIKMNDLYIDSNKIIDKANTKERLKIIFPKKTNSFFDNIFLKNEYKLVKKHLSKEQEFEIKKIGEPGLIFQNSIKRVYPQNNLFSQVTGFMSRHGEPQSKLELNLNESLSEGNDIVLTLDMKIQNIIHKHLEISKYKYKAEAAASLLLDVNTGDILSMISLPDFDPNHPSLIKPFTENNLITSSRYEMGSTLKIFNAAMAYENNSVDENELFDVSNDYQITKKHIIKDDFPSKKPLNFDSIFTKSSNIGSIKVLEKIGIEKQKIFLEKLGLGNFIKIKGISTIQNSLPKNWNNEISKSISFGYGISITPISLAKSYSSLVNGGFEINPNLILTEDKKNFRRVINEKTSKNINKLLKKIVYEGTGKKAIVNGLDVGGKTGTAKKFIGKNYNAEKLITSFVGVFPISNPKFLLFVIFDEPKKLKNMEEDFYGGNTAAPVFSKIVTEIAPILKIKSNRNTKSQNFVLTN